MIPVEIPTVLRSRISIYRIGMALFALQKPFTFE